MFTALVSENRRRWKRLLQGRLAVLCSIAKKSQKSQTLSRGLHTRPGCVRVPMMPWRSRRRALHMRPECLLVSTMLRSRSLALHSRAKHLLRAARDVCHESWACRAAFHIVGCIHRSRLGCFWFSSRHFARCCYAVHKYGRHRSGTPGAAFCIGRSIPRGRRESASKTKFVVCDRAENGTDGWRCLPVRKKRGSFLSFKWQPWTRFSAKMSASSAPSRDFQFSWEQDLD